MYFTIKKGEKGWDVVDVDSGRLLADICFIEWVPGARKYLTEEEAIQFAKAVNDMLEQAKVKPV